MKTIEPTPAICSLFLGVTMILLALIGIVFSILSFTADWHLIVRIPLLIATLMFFYLAFKFINSAIFRRERE